jgi:hypothetical protein
MMTVPLSLMNKRRYVAQRLVLSRDLALDGEVKTLLDVGCGDGILLSMIRTISRSTQSMFLSISPKTPDVSATSSMMFPAASPVLTKPLTWCTRRS